MQSLYVDEIFYSLQGEGLRVGYPSVFIRTGLCNFTCAGFGVEYNGRQGCDSYKAVDSIYKNNWVQYTDYLQIVKKVNSTLSDQSLMMSSNAKVDIVLTGGEPLLHWSNSMYQDLIEYFITNGHKVTIETNSALNITLPKLYQREIIFSASVKLEISGERQEKRINLKTLNTIFTNTQNSFLKFVTSKDSWERDIIEIKYILDAIPHFIQIYLMPLGKTKIELENNAQFIFEKAMKLGLNYSDRTHIRIYDDRAGV